MPCSGISVILSKTLKTPMALFIIRAWWSLKRDLLWIPARKNCLHKNLKLLVPESRGVGKSWASQLANKQAALPYHIRSALLSALFLCINKGHWNCTSQSSQWARYPAGSQEKGQRGVQGQQSTHVCAHSHMHALPVIPARPITLLIVVLILLQLTCSKSSSQGCEGLTLSCPRKSPEITHSRPYGESGFVSTWV